MELVGHIINRFLTHFTSAYGLTCGVWWGLVLLRKYASKWLPDSWLALLITAASIVCLTVFMREPYDVAVVKDWWGKSYFDFASWLLGSGISVWGQYRFYYRVKNWR